VLSLVNNTGFGDSGITQRSLVLIDDVRAVAA
jgi:hypothetical protein